MKNTSLPVLILFCLISFTSCSQQKETIAENEVAATNPQTEVVPTEPHRYGGWYCPDNLHGFPAVDIKDWKNVPVVNGRMATREEASNGTSLIFVDMEKYPNAKPLDMKMPRLARYFSHNSRKEEIVIVIQALNIQNDSIVGFRYLNGGNGSSRLNEVKFLSDDEIESIPPSRFITMNMSINATQAEIWKVLTEAEYTKTLQTTFDRKNTLEADWKESSKVNFLYLRDVLPTSAYAGNLFGNQYIQIDFQREDYQYVEKFLLSEDPETKKTELQIVCGPYSVDFEDQYAVLSDWAFKVKELSEEM